MQWLEEEVATFAEVLLIKRKVAYLVVTTTRAGLFAKGQPAFSAFGEIFYTHLCNISIKHLWVLNIFLEVSHILSH